MTPWQEQAAIERRDRVERVARIIRVGRENPDMPLCLIAERFNETEKCVSRILQTAGVRREPEYFADRHNGVRRAG